MAEENSVGSSVIFLKVASIPEVPDKKISKAEMNCIICGIPFTKKGAAQASRHACRFCYHAVCAACSPLTALHPETNNSERICLNCYSHYLEISIKESLDNKYKIEVQKELDKSAELIKTQQEIELRHKGEVDILKTSAALLEKTLKEQIDRLSKDLEQRESRVNSVSFDIGLNKNSDENTELNVYADRLKKLEIENQELKNRLTQTNYQAQHKGGCLSNCVIQ